MFMYGTSALYSLKIVSTLDNDTNPGHLCLYQFCHNFDRLNHIHGHDDDHQEKGEYNKQDQLEHKGDNFCLYEAKF